MSTNLIAPRSPAPATTYADLAARSEDATRSPATFTGLLASAPRVIEAQRWVQLEALHATLGAWQATAMGLLAASVTGQEPATLAAAVLDHLPAHVGWEHHRRLPLEHVGTPAFFRTDQAADGTILEVQCPGSLWGVHEILLEFFAAAGHDCARRAPALSTRFTAALRDRRDAEPVVHHLLDNSSHPAGERFFIQRARRGARYVGFDPDVRPQDCNFVRAHDFLALLAENFASERVRRLVHGDSVYDLPPVALFDQKLLLALPFWDPTRGHFSDAVRELFPYTTVLAPDGLRLETGEWVTLDQFAALPRRDRAYFLKYAGADVARNWGSRAVFHLGKLSRDGCGQLLRGVLEPYEEGERWIVQRAVASDDDVEFITRDGEVATTHAHAKHSVFFGPCGPLGVLLMFERFYKVHGSSQTITTVGVPG